MYAGQTVFNQRKVSIFCLTIPSCYSCPFFASTILNSLPSGPSPPKDVRAANKGPSIEISWTKPLHPILKFVKQFKIKITENKTSFDDIVRGDEFTYKLLNCKPSTCYSFQLFTLALNECESRASETVEIQTQGKNDVAVNDLFQTFILKKNCSKIKDKNCSSVFYCIDTRKHGKVVFYEIKYGHHIGTSVGKQTNMNINYTSHTSVI